MEKIKLQITPKKMVDDALIVWPERKPDVGIVLDPMTMEFKAESIKAIYAFGILGKNSFDEIPVLLQNLFNMLEQEGELYIIEDDFDYIARAYMGGDISLKEFNEDFRKQTHLNAYQISAFLNKAGFPEKEQKVWNEGIKFRKEHYQIIISGKKPITK